MNTQQTREERMDAFIEAYRRLRSISKACQETHIAKQTMHDWKKKYPEFAKQVDELKTVVKHDLEQQLYAIIFGRVRASAPQVTALIFALKGNWPEKYRDRYGLELTGKDGAVQVSVIEVVKDYGGAARGGANA